MPSVVTIDDIVLAATEISDSSGWNAPSKRTEEGYEYDSFVRPEPIEASIEGWIPVTEYRDLENLRQSGEPFPASIGAISIRKAKLDSLDRTKQNDTSSHYKVSLTITEIQEAAVETAEISIQTEDGASMGTSAGDTEPSLAQPDETDGGQVEDETNGTVGALASFRQSLSEVF